VGGAHDGEMPPVQSCDLLDLESFGEGDDAGIDRTEGQVGVLGHELRGAGVIGRSEFDDVDLIFAE